MVFCGAQLYQLHTLPDGEMQLKLIFQLVPRLLGMQMLLFNHDFNQIFNLSVGLRCVRSLEVVSAEVRKRRKLGKRESGDRKPGTTS
jgi:hypothetical protein